jgi:hypothetical protein
MLESWELRSASMDWFGMGRDIIVSGSAAVAAFVALRGLGAWRQQQKGKVEYDLARKLLTNTYRLRDAVAVVRASFIRATEMDSPPADSEYAKTPEGIRYHQEASAYQKRFAFVDAAQATLMGDLLEAEILWGKPVREGYDELFRLIATLAVTIQMHLQDVHAGGGQLTGEEHAEERSIIYEKGIPGKGKDSFNDKLRLALDKIEGLIRPALEKLR